MEAKKIGFISYDNKDEANNITPARKRIGYISYDDELVTELPIKVDNKEVEVPMSKA